MDLLNVIRSSKDIVIGGHRGQKGTIYRENTISCFETLVGKVPYIEVDVQLTADDVLVLYHDDDLSLQTPLQGNVRDYSLDELNREMEITTVEELIIWAKSCDMGVAFEIKLHPRKQESLFSQVLVSLGQLIEKYQFAKQCFVFSGHYSSLLSFKTLFSSIPIGLIVPFVPVDAVALMKKMHADIYLNYADKIPVSVIQQLRENDYLVDGSIINDEELLQMAKKIGIHMVESDYPLLLQKN